MRIFLFLAPPLAVVALAMACTSPSLVAAGGSCFVATDCEEGLVCVPQKDGQRICTNDVSSIVMLPAESGAASDAPPAMVFDAPTTTYDGPTSMPDTSLSTPDTSKTTPDTSVPPSDAADN